MDEFIKVVWLFYIYSFIGWLWETVYCSLKARHFVYRGFLIGPITPIYGFGILGVLYFIEPYQNNLLLLYVLSAILVTVLEYITSFALEKLFNASLWDYSKVPLNINGRVAIPVSLFWGVGCVLIVKVIHPRVLMAEGWLAAHFGVVMPIIMIVITLADLTYTVTNMASFKKVTKEIAQVIETSQAEFEARRQMRHQELQTNLQNVKDKIAGQISDVQNDLSQRRSEAAKSWQEYLTNNPDLREKLPKFNFNQRRIVRAFPNLKYKNRSNIKDIQELLLKKREK
ncbi:putative ABC transporter permease [Enterococcus sp. HY326]|uniref:putative ABC transporter permease n=1 Tax=Enterococcus sp. HY326 TaxID=2971265 RepID=UPI002240CC94|nr:putative ABC transporter permease [Enterococcus sp. HY326]